MSTKRWLGAAFGILAVTLLVSNITPLWGASPKPKSGGTLTYVLAGDALTFDLQTETAGASGEILMNIYNSLLRYNEKAEVVPELAKSWKISPDGLTYTFALRDDVYFHNGRKMTSADVKYTFERMLDPKTGSPRRENFLLVNKIETPDDFTVRFILKEPFAPLLVNFADLWAGILPKETVEDGSYKKKPVGTGPFMFKERVPGNYTLLEKNPKYFKKGLPYLDFLRVKVIPEETSIVAAMRSKTADAVTVWGKLFDILKPVKEFDIVEMPVYSWGMIQLNCAKPPLNNPKLRLAIAYAMNRQEIIDSVMLGNATVTAPVPEGMPTYTVPWKELPGYQQNYEKAKELLKEAGYAQGFTFELKTSTAYPPYVPTAQVVQSQLKPIGIKVDIVPMEWGAYLKDVLDRKYNACFHTFPSYTADPDAYLYRWFHSKGAWNTLGFNDPEVDALLQQGRTTSDPKARKEIYRKAQLRIAELTPAIYTWRTRVATGQQSYVKTEFVTPLRRYWEYYWLDK